MTGRIITVWYRDGTSQRGDVAAHDTPVPGLVVHADPSPRRNLWTVTHEASGAAVLSLPDPESALHAAIRLGPLADWTLPGSALRDLPGLRQKVLSVAGELDCARDTFSVRTISGAELAAAEAGAS